MKANKIHKAPVHDDEGRLVGIITSTDLIKICSTGSDSEMRHIADSILIRLQNSPHTEHSTELNIGVIPQ